VSSLVRLIGVYDADGGLVGDLAYVAKKLAGRGGCGLCDLTHGYSIAPKSAWSACAAELGVPVVLLHKNELSPPVAAAARSLPCVLGESADGITLLLDGPELASCRGDVATFRDVLAVALARAGLR
jgi:hypothetical protein